MAYPRFRQSRAHKKVSYTGGNITVNTTSYAGLNSLDLSINARIGDTVEYGLSGRWNSEALHGALDAASLVSGAAVNYWSGSTGTGNGVQAWFGPSGIVQSVGGSVMRDVVAGDLVSGVLTMRLYCRILASGSKLLIAAATDPLHVWVKNLGPPA